MNVFALSPIDSGETLTIECEGVDEKQAVAGFEKLTQEYSF